MSKVPGAALVAAVLVGAAAAGALGAADQRLVWQVMASGTGMIIVGMAAVVAWRRRSGCAWRWFAVGAAVWTVGVALKFLWAIALNAAVIGRLYRVFRPTVALLASSVYIGLLTGVFEVGITLLAGLRFRRMARDPARGIGVGVGAGAFEAFLLGLASVLGMLAVLSAPEETRDPALTTIRASARFTPLLWLVGPVERVTALLCHAASRALVLLGVAQGRWVVPFTAAFLLMTGIDSVAGYVQLTGVHTRTSAWWIELALFPTALISIPALAWCLRRWPDPDSPERVMSAKTVAPDIDHLGD